MKISSKSKKSWEYLGILNETCLVFLTKPKYSEMITPISIKKNRNFKELSISQRVGEETKNAAIATTMSSRREES